AGTTFAVWAPNARRVTVMGDFNGWNPGAHDLAPVGASGVWSGFVPGVGQGSAYKYHIESHHHGFRADKADPLAFYGEQPPRQASIVWPLDYQWNDHAWMRDRARRDPWSSPMTIYEVHLGSWRRPDDQRMLTYRELAELLPGYVADLGFTHVEFLPIM